MASYNPLKMGCGSCENGHYFAEKRPPAPPKIQRDAARWELRTTRYRLPEFLILPIPELTIGNTFGNTVGMPTKMVSVWECGRCGHIWLSRGGEKPACCAGCKSAKWDVSSERPMREVLAVKQAMDGAPLAVVEPMPLEDLQAVARQVPGNSRTRCCFARSAGSRSTPSRTTARLSRRRFT